MCHQNSCPCVTVEEDVAAEECLLVYCKPVELYNILHRRALYNPSFLARCLNYKIEAKLKTGSMDQNVIFNYRDQNSLLRKTEVTRHFGCPFCLMRCGSFKGLRCHLNASHDLFKCEFWISEEYSAVNVSVRTDALHSAISEGDVEPKFQSFSFCSKPRKRKRLEDPLEKGKNVFPQVYVPAIDNLQHPLDSNETDRDPSLFHNSKELHNPRLLGETLSSYGNGIMKGIDYVAGVPVARAQSVEDIDCLQNISLDKLPNAKLRKLSLDRSESRSSTLLQKRQFYHSRRAQSMALDQVMSDRDSEDEIDGDIADLEDRRMLDDFVDVSRDEKHLMHLWNSFVRKQRVLADGHVPWACEAFLRLHGKLLIESPALFWCWRLFMIKLWNHGLVDACIMNNCSIVLQKYRDEASADTTCSNTCKPEP